MRERYEVVLETSLYYTAYVVAEDREAAEEKALESVPSVHLPHGFEANDRWNIDGTVKLDEE